MLIRASEGYKHGEAEDDSGDTTDVEIDSEGSDEKMDAGEDEEEDDGSESDSTRDNLILSQDSQRAFKTSAFAQALVILRVDSKKIKIDKEASPSIYDPSALHFSPSMPLKVSKAVASNDSSSSETVEDGMDVDADYESHEKDRATGKKGIWRGNSAVGG